MNRFGSGYRFFRRADIVRPLNVQTDMNEETQEQAVQPPKKGFSGGQVLTIVFASVCLAVVGTVLALKFFLFPAPFEPVVLSAGEEQQLAAKLELFEGVGGGGNERLSQPSSDASAQQPAPAEGRALEPEKYSEEGLSREISFSERELNAMIAKNTDLADKLAVDLAENMLSAKLLIPLDPDFPMLGGKTLRVNAGAELAYRDARPTVVLKGVSIMGVPVPNAWLGGLKNIDLVSEFGAGEGFWKTFSDGVESISVVDGFLTIRLKE